MTSAGVLKVPSRFEVLRDDVGPESLARVLIKPEGDIPSLTASLMQVATSGQGKLVFLLGPTGSGKTSLAECMRLFLPSFVGHVITPPPDYELPIGNLPQWLAREIATARTAANGKTIIVNLDGREVPATDQAVTDAAMVNLNAVLRRMPKVLAVWPVVADDFAQDVTGRLGNLGGQSALAAPPVHKVVGIGRERYADVLRLILDVAGTRLEDAAISRDEVDALVPDAPTIGAFLERVQSLVVARYDVSSLSDVLPRLSIVITSGTDIANPCRQLRRGSKYFVDADRLLRSSRANVADDWRTRGARNPRHGLPFIVSLLDVRLLSVSASAVVNACALSSDEKVKSAVVEHYPTPVSRNAENSLKNSSLMRSIRGEDDVGPSTGAGPSDQILKAYAAVQALTQTKHREINEAIITVARRLHVLPDFKFEHRPLEHRAKELRVDAWVERGERPETFEFSHYGAASESVIASYVLSKIQDYARDYGLI